MSSLKGRTTRTYLFMYKDLKTPLGDSNLDSKEQALSLNSDLCLLLIHMSCSCRFMNFQVGVTVKFLASSNLLSPPLKNSKVLKGLIGFGLMLSNSIPMP